MGLKDVLEKMKLVETDAPEEVKAPSRSVPPVPSARRTPPPQAPRPQMSDIIQKIPVLPKIDEASLPKAGGDVPDFPAIYKASGVTEPPHGFTAFKVLEILQAPDFAGLEPKAKAAALSAFLRMNPQGPVPLADVIKDAVTRDHVLDNFEQFLQKKLEGRADELSKENATLQSEIDELQKRNQEKMEANRRTLEQEKSRFADWQARKRIEEQRLYDAVAPFVEENPVSVGSASGVPPAPTRPPSKG